MVIDINTEIVIRLVLAALFGAIVGYEREKKKMSAGLRTHMLVCVGAALITLTSLLAFKGGDPGRVAAGIVTGIGFLGAGAIIQERGKVMGITTAADIWVIAGVGLALGAGFYLGAVTTLVLLVIIMYYMKKFEIKNVR